MSTPRPPLPRPSIGALLLLSSLPACDGTATPTATPDGGGERAGDAAAVRTGPLGSNPQEIAFGCVAVNQPFAFHVWIENRGDLPVGPLSVDLAKVPDVMLQILTDGCGGESLAPGASCRLTLFLLVEAPRSIESSLTVAAPEVPALALPVTAMGLESAPASEAVVEPLAFDTVKVGESTSMAVGMVNLGKEMVTAPAASLQQNGAFRIAADRCGGRSLAPQGKCEVLVTFAPKTPGLHTDVLRLGADGCAPIPRVPLGGMAE